MRANEPARALPDGPVVRTSVLLQGALLLACAAALCGSAAGRRSITAGTRMCSRLVLRADPKAMAYKGGRGGATGLGALLPGQRCPVPLLVRGGTVRYSGAAVSSPEVAARVGWLVELARAVGRRLVDERSDDRELARLAARVDGQGRRLPSSAWMTARRLGWHAVDGDGPYLPDRVRHSAQEAAVRTLRSSLYRRDVLAVVLASWPASTGGGSSGTGKCDRVDWVALRAAAAAVRAVIDKVTVRNLTREVAAHVSATGRLPASLVELQPVEDEQALVARERLHNVDSEHESVWHRPEAFVARKEERHWCPGRVEGIPPASDDSGSQQGPRPPSQELREVRYRIRRRRALSAFDRAAAQGLDDADITAVGQALGLGPATSSR
jgi:hypothetical protein